VLKTLDQISTGLLITLGVVHLVFTLRVYDGFTLDALWFVSAGVAIIFAGLMNVVLLRGARQDRVVWWLGFGTNLTLALLFAAALRVLQRATGSDRPLPVRL